MPDLSVIILSYNTLDCLRQCLDALRLAAHADGLTLETIVIDNGSTDGSRAFLASLASEITTIENEANVGFAAANNQGLSIASAPVALLLNSDAFLPPGALRQALDLFASEPNAGVVGVRLLNLDGTLQAEEGVFPDFWHDVRASVGLDRVPRFKRIGRAARRPVDWVQGACMFVRMTAVHQAGTLDTRFFMYSEEVEWCRRFWMAGWQVWYLPEVAVVHVGGASSTGNDIRRRVALYRSRLGLRRRVDGPLASALLWLLILAGLAARVAGRFTAQALARRPLGRQTPAADWELLRAVLRMDPLARWAAS